MGWPLLKSVILKDALQHVVQHLQMVFSGDGLFSITVTKWFSGPVLRDTEFSPADAADWKLYT